MLRLISPICFLMLLGCDFFQPKEDVEKTPIARVNETILYVSDMEGLMPENLSAEDSIDFANKFIDDWIKKQLMIARSLAELDINEADIQRKVLDYRYALTRSAFEKQYIQDQLNETVPEDEIQQYYDSHSEDFVLRQNIIRCLFAQIPVDAPRQNGFKKNFQNYPTSELDDIREYCTQFSNRAFLEDSVWVDFDEVIGGTPMEDILDKNRILRTRKFIEDADATNNYFVRILETKMVNEVSPLEFVQEDIVNIIINKRKIALKRELENKVYEDAEQSNAFEIYSR